jgi:thymidylate synthase
MFTYTGTGANDVYAGLVKRVMEYGSLVPITSGPNASRNTRELHPAIIELCEPRERLVTAVGRPVNVAFALAEVLWILSGRNDVAMLHAYNSRIGNWSDNGRTFNAAYGARIRYAHGLDQLVDVEATLRADPTSRQAVISTWHPFLDNGTVSTKDRACNVLSHMMIRNGALDWLQIVRSNDLLWGTPYNWMQFTHLQEYLATRLGVPVGTYTHVADSLHIYEDHWESAEQVTGFDLYERMDAHHSPMVSASNDTMAAVFQYEEEIRTRNYLDSYGCSMLPRYWQHVLFILRAHQWYVLGDDHSVVNQLINVDHDPVYSTAMMRFYWRNRWSSGGFTWIEEKVRHTYLPEVAEWVLNG